MSFRAVLSLSPALAAICLTIQVASTHAGAPSSGTDVIVGELFGDGANPDDVRRWGKVGSTTGFSVGTISCNIGDAPLSWLQFSPDHPVIGMQMYRLKDDKFEQIGLSWVKHGFLALDEELCSGPGGCQAPPCCGGDWGDFLFPGCSDPYSSNLNGNQGRLGPRGEINASTGVKPYPYEMIGVSGNNIYKRMQIADNDIDPSSNTGARFFMEGQYITEDDVLSGNQANNVSWREAVVNETSPGVYQIEMIGDTNREESAIMAWQSIDPSVQVEVVSIAGDGIFMLANKVTDLGNGDYEYEYALYNQDSHRSAGSIEFPIGNNVTLSNTGFHDMHYHNGDGEPFGTTFSGTDWTETSTANSIEWATESHAINTNANALRWGTIYNFRFVADSAPKPDVATVGLFRPGSPSSIQIATRAPDDLAPVFVLGDMNANGVVDMPDVPLFVTLLLDPPAADADQQLRGDMNEDASNDAADLGLFVSSLAP